MEFLRLEQDHTEKKMVRLEAGLIDTSKKLKYVKADAALKLLVDKYHDETDKLKFLKNISYQIQLQK